MNKTLLKIAAVAAIMIVAMTTGQAQNVPITLEQGWNWISYPRSESMSINEALSGFTPSEGDVLKSQTGMAQYQGGAWIGDLTTLTPGKGYMYQSSDGTTKTFIFGAGADAGSVLPEEALDGEFTVDADGTKVRFSPGNLQCRVDPNQEGQLQVGAGTENVSVMPYYTWYNYSLTQMIYTAEELNDAGLSAGPITGIAFESYSDLHYQRDGVQIWMVNTSLTAAPSTSVSTSGMTQVFSGSVTQRTGWTEIPFTLTSFIWDGTSNVMVTVVMNHGDYNAATQWQSNNPGFTCSNYAYRDSSPFEPNTSTYSMYTTSKRPNICFKGMWAGATWRFAENQWDYIGDANAHTSSLYNGWIDLFGWGTSGHLHGAVCYQPWSTSERDEDYYAYSDASYNLNDQTGDADWGYNAISNGGDHSNQWRTLTIEEWDYLLNSRTGLRYAKAQVNGVNGLILLPDDWQASYYSLSNTNTPAASFTSNAITLMQWMMSLEQHGAVFLPAAGARTTSGVYYAGSNGGYWSASYYSSIGACLTIFNDSNLNTQGSNNRCVGRAVRLVCQSNPRIRTTGVTEVTSSGAKVCAQVDYTGTVTERGVCWNTNGRPTMTDSHLASGAGAGSFIAQLTGIGGGNTYHIRAYAKIGGTYHYGNELTFTTYEQFAVGTSQVTGITGTFARCGGTVAECGQNVTARGVCWGTGSNPTVSGNHTCDGKGTGSFSSMVENLTEGTTYHVRAYATTAEGTVYGNERTFTATSVVEVTTADVTDIVSTYATCGGTINNNGGSNAITARGVCWNETGNPVATTIYHTNDGTGPGSFTSRIINLTAGRTYYVRAYATTAQGTTYGSQKSFTVPTVPTGEITVTTRAVNNITTTTATSGGTVLSDGGPAVTARGVCWSATNGAPTLSDSHTTNGSGTGSFTSSLTGLQPNQMYFVRAYATTSQGTTYGRRQIFTTVAGQVTVSTNEVTGITTSTAICGGTVTSDIAVTARGVCWNTSGSPTVDGNHTTDGSGTGSFTSAMTGLTLATTYFVRAYATTAQGTTYGMQKAFTTADIPGSLAGVFSVSATQQVRFSQGNLQYKASTGTWRFAPNQYDYIGSDNSNISSSYSDYIDLFGWGTSNYNHGAVCYRPWSTSQTNNDYYAYGSATYNLGDQTGKADWGYNAISNGGNQANSGWRTLTKDEWVYVFNTRSTASGIRYAKATVNNVKGVILLPDYWSAVFYNLNNVNQGDAGYNSNVISASDWEILEQRGAVFLPAAGYRYGTSVGYVGSSGNYWSASCSDSDSAYSVYFGGSYLYPQYYDGRYIGLSVRLVWPAQ